MRIIAGAWRGRPIVAPPGEVTRPTADRTRETLFSMLVSRLGGFDGLRVADLFAGSGALGLEALSRGAARTLFVDQDKAAIAAIRANLDHFQVGDRADVRRGSALTLPPRESPHLILADPPYALDPAELLGAIIAANWLAPGGWLALEVARGRSVAVPPELAIDEQRDVGAARLVLIRR